MSLQERAAWDERFRTGDHAIPEPDPFLAQLEEYADLLPPGRRVGGPKAGGPKALDLACGAGRNAVCLAEKGWDVTAFDISLEGLRKAQELARERGVEIKLLCVDLERALLPRNHFDLIICFFYLQRELFPEIKASLRPQGLVLYRTYTVDQLPFRGRPRHPLHLLQPQELLEAFRDFRVLHYQEVLRDRGVAQLIAQKW